MVKGWSLTISTPDLIAPGGGRCLICEVCLAGALAGWREFAGREAATPWSYSPATIALLVGTGVLTAVPMMLLVEVQPVSPPDQARMLP